jgi:hypothetical protein
MNNVITENKDGSYSLTSRGNQFTLIHTCDQWQMWTNNAATRAWNRGGPSLRVFDTLEQVEAAYKSWRGIVALVGKIG